MSEIRVRELTPRQCAILNDLARGYENKLVAFHLGISEDTVKTQLKRTYRKLAVGSREDAVRRHHRLKNFGGHVCGTPNGPEPGDSEPVDDLSPEEEADG